jgi:hypothetical protein
MRPSDSPSTYFLRGLASFSFPFMFIYFVVYVRPGTFGPPSGS